MTKRGRPGTMEIAGSVVTSTRASSMRSPSITSNEMFNIRDALNNAQWSEPDDQGQVTAKVYKGAEHVESLANPLTGFGFIVEENERADYITIKGDPELFKRKLGYIRFSGMNGKTAPVASHITTNGATVHTLESRELQI